ncbi:MAG: hypothetical protein LQ350_003595 [Teloschistes chrysophthalmus]|nr:MAG: hypothetical protein LQ350_003595 [Niorma chrysophthalma]
MAGTSNTKRIAKDFKEICNDPPLDMSVQLGTDGDMHKWIVNIKGPKESPYATKIYHPNVSNDDKGIMCLGMLRDGEWKPSSKLSNALGYIRQLMIAPDVDDAIEQSIAREYKEDRKEFVKKAKKDGNDGPWSTFAVRIGTPPQTVRVLASTTLPETWVVSSGGCTSNDPATCGDSRGQLFAQNSSTTWSNVGDFELGVELNLRNYSGNQDNGNYGFDTLALGYQGSGGPTVDHSVVAGISTKDFYLGSIGLSSQPINFTTFDNPPASLLSQLKTSNQIPSLSYAYSAGAPYRLKKAPGSLTLGGYDLSKFTPNNVNFSFANDVSRDLVVGLQAIKYSGATGRGGTLMSDGIFTFIDSTIPHIWLPLDACQAFERAFGLKYDNATDLYLINSTTHDALKDQNPSVSFILGNSVQGGDTVNITLPYASFDLQVSSPVVTQATRYFPLRRATNDTQYTLGRTFLQEAYLTVDYERLNFSIAQAAFVQDLSPNLVPIRSINATSANSTSTSAGSKHNSGRISSGALAGTIIGVIALCVLMIFAVSMFCWKRRQSRRSKEASVLETIKDPELDGFGSVPAGELNNEFGDGKYRPPEVEGSAGSRGKLAEAQGSCGGVEMEGTRAGTELHGSGGIAEMDGEDSAVQELDAVHVYELPAGDVKVKVARSKSGQERIKRGRRAPFRGKQPTGEQPGLSTEKP